jgi:PAS domain S-box-containing protein
MGARKPTIASKLVWLVAACVLPGALIAAMLVVNQYQQGKARIARDALATARALAANVDRELTGVQSGLFALATSPYLAAGDLRAFHGQAVQALREMQASNIVLVDAQGRQMVNTLRPFSAPVPGTAPAQVLRIFETGRPAVSNLFSGTVLKRPLVGINVPVRSGDNTVYALGAALLPERLSALLSEQHLPPGWIAAILDGSGAFVARSQGIERYLGNQAAAPLVSALQEARESVLETDTLEGIPVYGAFARSGVSEWAIAIAIPRQHLVGPLRRSLLLLAAITAGLLAAGMGLAWAIGGGIARAIRGLTAPARALALDRVVTIPELGLREAEEVGRVLAQTSVRLRAATETRERAEREVRESEQRRRLIFDNMFPFVGLLSLDGRVMEVNLAPLEAAGLTREEVIGQPCAEMRWFGHSPEVQERLRAALVRAGAGEAVRYDETIAVSAGRFMAIDLMFSPLRDAQGGIACIVGSATDITERQRAERKSRELARRLMETEETERRNLNRELHDRVAANLSAASLGLSMVRSQLPPEGAPAARLEELEKLLAHTVAQARDLMAELSPPALVDFGLPAALGALADVMKARSGLQVAVRADDIAPRPPLTVETAFLRIAQEALTNVLKHAGTDRAELRLVRREGGMTMVVSDTGAGFDPGAKAGRPTWGLRTLRERAEAIGASLAVDSAPGRGTRITVELRGGA